MNPNVIIESTYKNNPMPPIEALLLMQQKKSFLPEIFAAADDLNRKINNNIVYYQNSNPIIYGNICKASCKFCTFSKKKGDDDSYFMEIDELISRIKASPKTDEVVLQGGINPDIKFVFYEEMIKSVRKTFPKLYIKAFSPGEIHAMAKRNRMDYYEILYRLKDAGINAISGTSAEILNDKLRKKICPDKVRSHDWLDIIKIAHSINIKTSASILFGHIENEIYIIEHLDIIRQLQEEFELFDEFTLFPYFPGKTKLGKNGLSKKQISWDEIFRIFAVTRLFFKNFIDNIQVPWELLGIEMTIKALQVGINDIGPLYAANDGIKFKTEKCTRFNTKEITRKLKNINMQLKCRNSMEVTKKSPSKEEPVFTI